MTEETVARGQGCRGYQRVTRRSWLGIGSGGILSLTGLAEKLAVASQKQGSPPKSLLVLWLQGGPSQYETFDPHPGTKYGGEVRSISTSIPKIEISDALPATAEQMHQVCLLRSVISKEGDHERATYHLKTGWRPEPTVIHPSIGSILCHSSPGNLEIPRHISILPSQWPARGGYLGPSLDAFQTGDPAEPIANLKGWIRDERMPQLSNLLSRLEVEFQQGRMPNLDRSRTLHETATRNALTMMSSDQLKAFDLSNESESTCHKFGNTAFGRGCLAGIRLLEVGVRCVEVELNGWDSHINNHELQMGQCKILDKALAATLAELAARDLLDSTIVFCGGEFGRTPKLNPAGGRDHWPHGFSTLLAGGPFRRGYVHGATAAEPNLSKGAGSDFEPADNVEKPVTVPDLHASILHALGISYMEERLTPVGRPLRWSDGTHCPDLFA